MKAQKVLKRIAKIEALISKVTERFPASAPNIRALLRDAKAAVIRAKEAVQASFETPKNLPAKHPSKATLEPSKPKRKLPAAGRKATSAAGKKLAAKFQYAQGFAAVRRLQYGVAKLFEGLTD